MNRKAVVPLVAIAIISIIASLAGWGTYFAFFIYDTSTYQRTIKEREILFSINKIELLKRALDQALSRSFEQSSYDAASRGGYFDLSQTESLDCIPYWIYYSEKNIPDFEAELQENTKQLFNSYSKELSEQKILIPEFDVKIDRNSSTLTASSNSKIEISKENLVTIREIAIFSRIIEISLFDSFEEAKDVAEKVSSEISSVSSYDDAVSGLQSLESSTVNIEPSENLGSSESKFSIRAKVSVTDSSKTYLVYDASEQTIQERNVKFIFYVQNGNEEVEKEKSDCEQIQY